MPRPSHKTLSLQEQPEETRTTIIRIATQLFMANGYRAVSTRQIADACNLTQPALYHYFSDKQHLYVAVVQQHALQVQAGLTYILRTTTDIHERLRHVVHHLLNTTHYDLNLMMHDIQHELDPEHQATLSHLFYSGLITPIASIFADGVHQHLLLSPDEGGTDPFTAASLFMSMLSHFITHDTQINQTTTLAPPSALKPKKQQDGEHAEIIVHILLHGLARKLSPL